MNRIGDMRRVIERKMYDTETAEPLHTFEPVYDTSDFHYYIETLYVTEKGTYFVAGEGGAMSPYAESLGGGSFGGGSGIQPLSISEAIRWLEETGGSEVLATNERFNEHLSQA